MSIVQSGDTMAINSDSAFYIPEDILKCFPWTLLFRYCVDDAFKLLNEINEPVTPGIWVGGCFVYNSSSRNWKLNYCIGGELDRQYIAEEMTENRENKSEDKAIKD
ncbi:hypothetical protein K1719_000403 [Acacia pycnantha]|nr:hypothetical protein K1719_000403 [Acacia pycnantha]